MAKRGSDRGREGAPAPQARRGPPVARAEPHVTALHGVELPDPYRWLRERESPEVIAHLEEENRYTDEVMGGARSLVRELYDEMLGRIQEDDASVPVAIDDRFYYSRTESGRPYRIHCRRSGSLAADEEVILDVNELAEGREFLDLGALAVSPDHRLLAYSVDETGGESYVVRVKDLASGELLDDVIPGASTSLVWAEDGRTLLYAVLDQTKRPFEVRRHRLGRPVSEDAALFRDPDRRFFVSVGKSRSRRFLVVRSRSAKSAEVWLVPAEAPDEPLACVAPRRQDVEYDVTHHEDLLLVRTNEDAPEFRLLAAPLDAPERARWREVVPERPDVKLEHVDAFRDFIVRVERADGLRRLVVGRLDGEDEHEVDLPEPVHAVSLASNPDYRAGAYRFSYSSLVTPSSVFDYHVAERRLELKKRQPVLGGYDASLYETRRIHATAPDGTRVPVSLVHRRGLARDASHPCLLYGYGAYGICLEPSFSSIHVSLLERGFVYAIAHVRGGGELGESWHEAGRLVHKTNTFEDFVAAADALVEEGYARRDMLAIRGGSAGGLLVGAALNMRPDLCRVALVHVPFVDVVNTMLDPDLPLTVTEYEEWGNPRDERAFRTMLSYSPYDNVRAADYPAMLVTAGLNDPRVQYWEPAKWVARLRATATGGRRLLLKTNMGAGHGGPSGRYGYLEERAFEFAFLLDTLGLGGARGPRSPGAGRQASPKRDAAR